jgi:hypothetical protein
VADAIAELDALLNLLNALGTFSQHCRSGVVGDLCRCWRCRGEQKPTSDEAKAERDALLIDKARDWSSVAMVDRRRRASRRARSQLDDRGVRLARCTRDQMHERRRGHRVDLGC